MLLKKCLWFRCFKRLVCRTKTREVNMLNDHSSCSCHRVKRICAKAYKGRMSEGWSSSWHTVLSIDVVSTEMRLLRNWQTAQQHPTRRILLVLGFYIREQKQQNSIHAKRITTKEKKTEQQDKTKRNKKQTTTNQTKSY